MGGGLLESLQHLGGASHRDFCHAFGAGGHRGDQGDVGAARGRHLGEGATHLAAGEIPDVAHRVDGLPGAAGADDHAQTVERAATGQHSADDGDDPLS